MMENCSAVRDDKYIENVVMQENVNNEITPWKRQTTPASAPRSQCQEAYIHIREADGINGFNDMFRSSPENGLS